MTRLVCPKCSREVVRRSKRIGVVEQIISLAYIYPFRCEGCDRRFWALQWGVRYAKVLRRRSE